MAFSTADFSDWSKLAEGGEAEVFRARQMSLDRLVAIKRLKLAAIGDAAEVRRFESEAKLCASLSHPCLVQVYDYGHDEKFYYLVMEYLPGVDLGRLISTAGSAGRDAGGSLPVQVKIHLARQMAEVVDFIHAKGVLHRDLKPENFMVDPSGRVKLLDLGLAFDHNPTAGGRRKGSRPGAEAGLRGTLAYLPPEILKGGAWQAASECYSLAVVLLELFGDERLQQGRGVDELLGLIQNGISADLLAGVPQGVRRLLVPFLDADPSRRPHGLANLTAVLKAMAGGTVRLGGGLEALQAALAKEKKNWLWTLVRASESAGRWEEAFARLKELLESDPEDAEAQAKLAELGQRLNDGAPEAGASRARTRTRRYVLAAVPILAAGVAAFIYIQDRAGPASGRDDMGHDLMERELNLLSQEGDSGSAATRGSHEGRPALPPYGILIVEGLPKEYRVVVNRTRYPNAGEIHLPASRYLLEIQDSGARSVLRDSVTVGGGEPTVYRYAGEALGR